LAAKIILLHITLLTGDYTAHAKCAFGHSEILTKKQWTCALIRVTREAASCYSQKPKGSISSWRTPLPKCIRHSSIRSGKPSRH